MVRRDAIHAVLMATGLLIVPCAASASERANVRLRDGVSKKRVEQVLSGAARRFATAGCADVLSFFRDQSGRPLTEVLGATGQSPSAYLDTILFYDGSQEEGCRKRWILAKAMPGTRVVKICPAFYESSRRDPVDAEATLIHEALHTLGLGENPPASRDITRRIIERCMSDQD